MKKTFKNKIFALQIGSPKAFKHYTLNVVREDGSVEVLKISKSVADTLMEKYNLSVEG